MRKAGQEANTVGVQSGNGRLAMHIAFVTSGLGAGGAEQVIAQLAADAHAHGHRVEVIAFDHPDEPVYHRFPAGVRLVRLGKGSGLGGTLARIIALRRYLAGDRTGRAGLVVSFLTKINLVAALAVLGTPARLVCAERNNPERQGAHPLWNRLLAQAYRRADAIVCQTESVRRCFGPALQDRLVTIPNPVPVPQVEPAAPGTQVVCAVGRLTRQKGFDKLVEAFAAIAPSVPGWRLEIWGQGTERAALEAQIAATGLQSRVVLCGLSETPRGWIAQAEIFVLASRYEGFPNALAEAMAAGLPVIATACDFGPGEMIAQGRSGVLVDCIDGEPDVAGMATALEGLIKDAGLRASLGHGAALAMERYRPEQVLGSWLALFSRLARAHCVSAASRGGAILRPVSRQTGDLP